MNRSDYDRFTARLTANLAADDRVLGLVAAGSMADTDHAPDEWSDHDFWIVTEPGAQEDFRARLDWLPDHDRIVLAFRETAHGLKIVYDSGHLLEYAVFDREEQALARVNSYRVLLDRADIASQMTTIRQDTTQQAAERAANESYEFGQFLTNLLVGSGRYARGERLSAHILVKSGAVIHLTQVLHRYGAADEAAQGGHPAPDHLDNLNSRRRFERAFPLLGDEINALLLQPIPTAALGLLALADRILRDQMPDYPAAAVDAVRGVIQRSAASNS
jgi:lincosamide nucleotidyltransferase